MPFVGIKGYYENCQQFVDDMPDNNLFKFHEGKAEPGLCARKKESLGLVVQAVEHLSSVK